MWGRNSFVWTSFGIFKAYRPTQLEVLFLSHAAAKPTNGDHLSLGCRGYAAIPWAQDMELQTFSTTCYNLQRCIEVMDNGGLVLNGNDAQEASNCLKMFLSGYAWLASHFLGQRLMLFLMRPKHHCLYHQAVQLGEWRLNQNLFQTCDDESFLGKLKNIFTACHGKTAPWRMYSRYLLVLAMFLENRRRAETDLDTWMLTNGKICPNFEIDLESTCQDLVGDMHRRTVPGLLQRRPHAAKTWHGGVSSEMWFASKIMAYTDSPWGSVLMQCRHHNPCNMFGFTKNWVIQKSSTKDGKMWIT